MLHLRNSLTYMLIFTIVSSSFAYKIIMTAYDNADLIFYQGEVVKAHPSNVKVSNPKPEKAVASPLLITGEARGSWYFEASFPVQLLDANGSVLAASPAQALEDWMTTKFVPFRANLTFTKPTTPTGMLVLKKDNPSGDSSRDESISIPVRFSP